MGVYKRANMPHVFDDRARELNRIPVPMGVDVHTLRAFVDPMTDEIVLTTVGRKLEAAAYRIRVRRRAATDGVK